MRTSNPPAPPPTNDALALVQQLFGLLGRGLAYWGRRTRQQPRIGLLYAVIWLPALFLLAQNAHQALALKLTPRFRPVEHTWPLTGMPWPPAILIGLVVVMLVVVFVDIWLVGAPTSQSAAALDATLDDLPARPVPPDTWAVGRVVTRTWQPDPGEWEFVLTEEIFTLTGQHLRVGLLVDAPPGGGKTSLILKPILHLCFRMNWAAVVFDVKGNNVAAGDRPDYDPTAFPFDVTIDFTNPAHSAKLNIAAGDNPRAIGEQWGEALLYDPNSQDQYFVGNAREAAGSLAAAHHRAYGRTPDFRGIITYLRTPDARKDLAEQLRKAGRGARSEEQLDLARIETLLAAKDADPIGRLDLALAPLARGEIADLLVTDDSGVRIWDLLQQRKRVRVILPVESHPYIAPIIGRLVLAQFTQAVLDGRCGPGELKVALIDEAHWFVTPSVAAGMAGARANGGCFVLAFQDTQQIHDPNLRAKIRAVSGNLVLFPGIVKEDADDFSGTFPAHERLFITHSQTSSSTSSSSRTSGSGSHTTGSSRNTGTGSSTSTSSASGDSQQVRERRDWLPAELRYLARPGRLVIERRDAAGNLTPPTVIAVDHALAAALRRNQEIGAALQRGMPAKGLPPVALIPAPVADAPAGSVAPPVALPHANPTQAAAPAPPDEQRAADRDSELPDVDIVSQRDGLLSGVDIVSQRDSAERQPEAESARNDGDLSAVIRQAAALLDDLEDTPPAPNMADAPVSAESGEPAKPWAGPPRERLDHLLQRNQIALAGLGDAFVETTGAPSAAPPATPTDDQAATLAQALQVERVEAEQWIAQAQAHGWPATALPALLAEVQADKNAKRKAAAFQRRIAANKPPVACSRSGA